MLTPVTAGKAQTLIAAGEAVLVDIREQDERRRRSIPGSLSSPISGLGDQFRLHVPADKKVIFHCKSGMRTQSNAARLASLVPSESYSLDGGLDAWTGPVDENPAAPIEIIRQVQITAGLMILLGVVLGYLVDPGFFALSGFVGAGLLFAGITGTCALAGLLARLPWNKQPSPRPDTLAQA
ncbi:MAG: rhodanese family protein [Magnetovibrionaceae bacterium]